VNSGPVSRPHKRLSLHTAAAIVGHNHISRGASLPLGARRPGPRPPWLGAPARPARLLVYPRHLLAGGQALADDRDDLAVGGRLLLQLAIDHVGYAGNEPVAALQRLQQGGRLLDGEFNFLRGLWTLSQQRGAHQGLTTEEEALFRLQTTTSAARFLLHHL
jgi:hypothetical protein